MPNHITNILTAYGDKEKVRAMFEAIKNDEIGTAALTSIKLHRCRNTSTGGIWAGRK
jgi:hypothetical protein